MDRPSPSDENPDTSPVATTAAAYRARLGREDSVLLKNPAIVDQIDEQVRSVVGDVLARVGLADSAAPDVLGEALSVEIGADQAMRGIHPVESLRAAAWLFEEALPVLVRYCEPGDTASILALVMALHDAVAQHVAHASLSYVNFLLHKLRVCRHEERRRIARELHDRVGHAMGLALQHVDLHRFYLADGQQRLADEKLSSAITLLGDAMRTIQQLSAELRRSVDRDGVEKALRTYVEVAVPITTRVNLTITGDPKTLPTEVSEELFLIVREAIRNTVRHAEATELYVTIAIGDGVVDAIAQDNGRGFHREAGADRGRQGLPSMAERAELLRGTFRLWSEPGKGTRVEVHIPLSGFGQP